MSQSVLTSDTLCTDVSGEETNQALMVNAVDRSKLVSYWDNMFQFRTLFKL